MTTSVESIVEGTWGSGQPPAEFIDFFLMHEMGWSYTELEATPVYVRRYCYDFAQMILAQEREQADKQRRASEHRGQM